MNSIYNYCVCSRNQNTFILIYTVQDLCTNQTGILLPLSVKHSYPGNADTGVASFLFREGVSAGLLAFQRCECWGISLSLTVAVKLAFLF